MSVRVLQISDMHLLQDAESQLYKQRVNLNFVNLLERIRPQGPFDLILLTGDNSEDGTSESYSRILDSLQRVEHANLLAIAGNHDNPATLAETLPTGDMSFDGWQVLTLDSHWPGHVEGRVGESQLATLASRLDQAGDAHVLVAVHHPPHFPCNAGHCALSDATELLATIDRPSVRLVVSGHVHDDYAHRSGVTLFSTAPSTCIGFDHDPAGHRISRLRPGAIIYQLETDGGVGRQAVYLD